MSVNSSYVDEDSFLGRSASKSRKLVKKNPSRSRSPGAGLGSGRESENERASPRRRSRSASLSRDSSLEYSDHEEEVLETDFRRGRQLNQSELNLSRQLELARRNSRNQRTIEPSMAVSEQPVEETIYEGMITSRSREYSN